ncbi:MAG: transposase [Verrucomicrobia bacterium]|nr:transposase [Verrucomicrobiota bacterium]
MMKTLFREFPIRAFSLIVAGREKFLRTLTEACLKTEWQLHAYCLMGNHFHLVIETPQAKLVSGMKWLLGVQTRV